MKSIPRDVVLIEGKPKNGKGMLHVHVSDGMTVVLAPSFGSPSSGLTVKPNRSENAALSILTAQRDHQAKELQLCDAEIRRAHPDAWHPNFRNHQNPPSACKSLATVTASVPICLIISRCRLIGCNAK